MYIYYIRDDVTGQYLIGRMKLGAPVATCIWGDRRGDMLTFETAMEARYVAREIVGNAVSIYRINVARGTELKLKNAGGDNQ